MARFNIYLFKSYARKSKTKRKYCLEILDIGIDHTELYFFNLKTSNSLSPTERNITNIKQFFKKSKKSVISIFI